MEILDQIKNDLKKAQLDKDDLTLQTLRLVLSEIHNFEINQRSKNQQILLDDILLIIQKEIKKRKEAKDLFLKGNRMDLVNQTENEIKILSKYVPSLLSNEEILKIINDLRNKGLNDFNSLMKEIMQNYKGRVDGKEVKKLIEQILQ
ncbi:MAG: GatB/YqeY domain-containing protein [Patescibacteria group bacterium]|nr:GatB/YqeY domain-containing protein [Patescibacteria group bacterium]MCX7589939.1 GatB/YqeY domain-containing protein [Patescibacteria group bacterium]MDW8279783.1 GatB/YqeY domain-containing protein [bacterium]